MNGLNFRDDMRHVLDNAREEAHRLKHEYVGTEHMLLALLHERMGVGSRVLDNLHVDRLAIQQGIEQTVRVGTSEAPVQDLPYTTRAKNAIEYSIREATELKHNYVGNEHLLLGLLREGKGIAAQYLIYVGGVTTEKARAETLRILS